jgi:hypothetical protein
MADDLDERIESPEERRANDRSRLILDVVFDGEDTTGVASTKDISVGGLYMNTQATIPQGAVLLVRIPFRADATVVCRAEVIYSEPGRGLGLRFIDLSAEGRALLGQEVGNG